MQEARNDDTGLSESLRQTLLELRIRADVRTILLNAVGRGCIMRAELEELKSILKTSEALAWVGTLLEAYGIVIITDTTSAPRIATVPPKPKTKTPPTVKAPAITSHRSYVHFRSPEDGFSYMRNAEGGWYRADGIALSVNQAAAIEAAYLRSTTIRGIGTPPPILMT